MKHQAQWFEDQISNIKKLEFSMNYYKQLMENVRDLRQLNDGKIFKDLEKHWKRAYWKAQNQYNKAIRDQYLK